MLRAAARALILPLACFLALAPLLRCQNEPPVPLPAPAPQGTPLDETTVAALERLTKLLADKRAERDDASRTGNLARVAVLDAELRELGWQFGGLASRLDVQQFEAPQQRQFDLKAELEDLVRPLIQTLKDATEEPRQIAELQGRIDGLQARQRIAEVALRGVEGTRDALPTNSPARAEAVREIVERWRPTLDALHGEILVLRARLLAREQSQSSLLENLSKTARNFVQTSGLSLLLAFAVFVTVLFSLRFVQNRFVRRRSADRALSLRLLEVLFSAVTMVLAIGAMLVVPYVRNDWLLLAVGIVFLIGVGWVMVRMLPQFFEQIRLVLNVGGVREGERIVIDGLPYHVDHLRFYSRLHNPDLQGGELRVPIQELIGKRSRRSGTHEPWFPCRVGEIVMLADGVFGAVLLQTPGVVVVENFGSPRSYATAAFLAQQPRNLSRGFVVDTTFGIDYRHQQEAPTAIPVALHEALQTGLGPMVAAGQLVRIDVQFAAANTSSLDYVVLAEFTGEAAARYFDLRRAMQGLLVQACSSNGWTIPFPQLVVHRPGP